MKKILIETEYTNDEILKQELISISLIDMEDGDSAYLELSDFSLENCSNYVKENVLPLLRGEKADIQREEVMDFLASWLRRRGPCDIVGDNLNDFVLLKKYMNIPSNVEGFVFLKDFFVESLNLKGEKIEEAVNKYYELKKEVLIEDNLSTHHSAEDAEASYKAFKKLVQFNRKLKVNSK